MKKVANVLLVTVLSLVLGVSMSFAKGADYDEGSPGDATLSGVVTLKGEPPAPIMEDLNKGKNSEFCVTHPDTGKDGIRPRVKVTAKGGKLNGAIVFIEGVDKGKPWPAGAAVDFKTCDIFPKTFVTWKTPKGVKDGVLVITNQDTDILHNPHGYSVAGANRKTLFNEPLPSKGSVADATSSFKRFKAGKDEHFFLQCDQHNYMEADARIVYNPYFAVTGEDGSFKIDGIPAGKYKVIAWHPYVGEVTKEIDVKGEAKADFELAMK